MFTALLVLLTLTSFAQQWITIKSEAPSAIKTELVSSSENQIVVNLQVPGFYTQEVTTPRGEANIISVPKTVSTAAAGEPDLPMIAIPALIGDHQHYNIRVVEAQYADFQTEVAPSKGDFPRTINPDEVPYTYGEAYSTNAFFPAENVSLYEPYILRDFRGQNMVIFPFAYNAITHTLRVYYNMIVEMYVDGTQGENILDHRSSVVKMDPEFRALYNNHFINHSEGMNKYTPVDETGELLIICYDAFMDAMQPFVNWKKQIGRPTTMVGTSIAGSTADAIKAYIQSQYNSNSNLTHVLLVGDVAQVPGHSYDNCGAYNGKSDNWYGQITGNDYYNELIIGRFSAENTTQVTTQVNKVINYERDLNASDTWLVNGCGIAATAGSGGHFGEDDWQHINNIRTDLLNYGYSTVYQEYYNTMGYTSTTQQISDRINSGVSIINYCNHGSYTEWQSHYPRFDNSYVNALTNDYMLPIIWSVACLNGKYDYSQPCFAETWMRATNNSNGNPTGAIGGMFSYISQPWVPPMYGQDEMVDVLVESHNDNIKRTLGGCSFDGNMKILDQYGQSGGQGLGTYMAWILYGDPTLTMRTAIPTDMGVTHASSIGSSSISFIVNATHGNGALATLTRDNEIIGSATINDGTAIITFAAPGTTGTATLTVFGYNKITYIATIDITPGGGTQYTVNVSANPVEGGTVAGGGIYNEGQNCTVKAITNDGFIFTNWTENDIVVSTEANYTFNVTSDRTLVANFEIHTPCYAPSNLTATATENSILLTWQASSAAISYSIYRDSTLIANNITTATYTDSDLEYSHEYCYTVRANCSNDQLSDPSNEACATTENYDCQAPDYVEAHAISYTDIYITWNGVPTAESYKIYRNGTLIVWGFPYVGDYYDTALPYGEYCYTIVSECEYGDSEPSEEVCVTLTIPCNAPANFTAEYVYEDETDFGVRLHWNSVAPISPELFHLYRMRNTTEYELIADLQPEGSTYTFFDVTEIGTYSYMLTAEYHFDGQICVSEPVYASCLVTSVSEKNHTVEIYPNPTSGEITLAGEGLSHVRIVNAYGQTVYNADLEGNQVRIDLSQMAKGVYMMHLEAKGGQTMRKIVVE